MADALHQHSLRKQTSRWSSIMRTSLRPNDFSILEDRPLDVRSDTKNRRSTIFAKPARRPILTPVFEDGVTTLLDGATELGGSRLESHPAAARDARRRTIWVPSDDTTVMTIHPGAQTRTLSDDTIAFGKPAIRNETICLANGARRASLMQAPRRAPLSAVKKPPTNQSVSDRPGCPTGKENQLLQKEKVKTTKPTTARPIFHSTRRISLVPSVLPPKQLSMVPIPPVSTDIAAVKERLAMPSISLTSRKDELAVVQEDLEHPELFEGNWLSHQEASLSQILNCVLEQVQPRPSELGLAMQRAALLAYYQQPHFLDLHRRITTSIRTGALSHPKTCEIPRLQEDVGLRRNFVELLLNSYEHHKLWAAAEVVSARVLKLPPSMASGAQDDKTTRNMLGRFLISTLIPRDKKKNDPNVSQSEQTESRLATWQTTVVRSLMIVALLDQSHRDSKLEGCLFMKTSPHKSSESLLRALGSLVLPSIGDLIRTLGYLQYSTPYSQLALQEYNYEVTNIATDLRDGVLLARLVEVLMYSNESTDTDTISITLPTGDYLESVFDAHACMLSQHLRYPCPTRAQKLYNVQISLSALDAARGLTQTAASTIIAADIVDGHRERTLSFLWAILSRWGLHMLVPIASLRGEIKRLASHLSPSQLTSIPFSVPTDTDLSAPDTVAALLKTWAATLCIPHGIVITNLTTSFASPSALAAIVATYASCVPTTSGAGSLASRLKHLGCSAAFAQLASTTHIPTKATTLCALSFLAARLIPLARRLRSVETLQRAWRIVLARREMRKRIMAMRVAHQCAGVVAARQRVEWAVAVMQRAWRRVRYERMRRAEERIEGFQAVARAWAVRRALGGVLPTLIRREERVRGGW